MSDVTEWIPLPKRAKRGAAKSDPSSAPVAPVVEPTAETTTNDESIHLRHDREISENIEARSKAFRAVTALTDQDGCGGEFFECKSSTVLVLLLFA